MWKAKQLSLRTSLWFQNWENLNRKKKKTQTIKKQTDNLDYLTLKKSVHPKTLLTSKKLRRVGKIFDMYNI